ncbi:MAG TPA: hypothetical protein VGD21_01290, partial [Lysobacter sp.]
SRWSASRSPPTADRLLEAVAERPAQCRPFSFACENRELHRGLTATGTSKVHCEPAAIVKVVSSLAD